MSRFVVVGAGAIGSVVAAALPEARVTLVARGARLAALRAHGLVIETPTGVTRRALASVERIPAIEPGDLVLVATKTQDVAAVLRELALVAPATTPVACVTNGLEAERLAARWFANVYGVCVMCPATHVSPDAIQAWGTPVSGIFDVGTWFGGADPIATSLAAALAAGGLRAQAVPDIARWKRTKLILNLANAVDALCGRAARDSALVQAIRDEGRACFAAAGLALASADEDAARRAGFATGEIAGRTHQGGSTWQSLARGSGIECEYFNGEIVALGRAHGVPTPYNAGALRAIARAARDGVAPGSVSVDDLARQIVVDVRA